MNLLDHCVTFRIGLSVSTEYLAVHRSHFEKGKQSPGSRAISLVVEQSTCLAFLTLLFWVYSFFWLDELRVFQIYFFKEPTFFSINPLYYLEFFLFLFCYCPSFYYFFLATAFGYGLISFFQSLKVYCIKLLIWDLSIFLNIGSEYILSKCKIFLGLTPRFWHVVFHSHSVPRLKIFLLDFFKIEWVIL